MLAEADQMAAGGLPAARATQRNLDFTVDFTVQLVTQIALDL